MSSEAPPSLMAMAGGPPAKLTCRSRSRIIDRSRVVPVLSTLMDPDVGRHRTVSLRGLLVACQLNALARHHRCDLVEVARIIHAFTDDHRRLWALSSTIRLRPTTGSIVCSTCSAIYMTPATRSTATDRRQVAGQSARGGRRPKRVPDFEFGGRGWHRCRDVGHPVW